MPKQICPSCLIAVVALIIVGLKHTSHPLLIATLILTFIGISAFLYSTRRFMRGTKDCATCNQTSISSIDIPRGKEQSIQVQPAETNK